MTRRTCHYLALTSLVILAGFAVGLALAWVVSTL